MFTTVRIKRETLEKLKAKYRKHRREPIYEVIENLINTFENSFSNNISKEKQ